MTTLGTLLILGLCWLWAATGLIWLVFLPEGTANRLGGVHVLRGGPVVWLLAAIVFQWVVYVQVREGLVRFDAAVTEWSLRPVERAVNEYQTQGVCHG